MELGGWPSTPGLSVSLGVKGALGEGTEAQAGEKGSEGEEKEK